MQHTAPFNQNPDQHAPHAGHPPIGGPDHSHEAVNEFDREHGGNDVDADVHGFACLGSD